MQQASICNLGGAYISVLDLGGMRPAGRRRYRPDGTCGAWSFAFVFCVPIPDANVAVQNISRTSFSRDLLLETSHTAAIHVAQSLTSALALRIW